MEKPKIERKKPEEIPSVMEFLHTDEAIQEFKADNAEVIAEYEALIEKRNAALEAAEKEVRQNKVSCGPFDLSHFSTKYDAEKLYDAIGKDKFLEVGGKISTATLYTVDKERVEVAIVKKKIPKEVVEEFRKVTASYHKPEKAVLP